MMRGCYCCDCYGPREMTEHGICVTCGSASVVVLGALDALRRAEAQRAREAAGPELDVFLLPRAELAE